MHRKAASKTEFNLQSEDLIFLEQTPAKFVFLTSADTDIQTIAAAVSKLPPNFDEIRVANLLNLQHQISIDNYAEQFDMKIKDTFEFAQGYIGVGLALGLVLYLVMLIPLVGALLGPVIVSVTGALVMYQLSDLHIREDLL